jgi:hypothetical protein
VIGHKSALIQFRWKHEPYTKGNINTFRYSLNGDINHCPKCSGKLFREDRDIVCLSCGFRETNYLKG